MWHAKNPPQLSDIEEEILELGHEADNRTTEYPSDEELHAQHDNQMRRRYLIDLHVAGRKRHGKEWDAERPFYIFAATYGRTKSTVDCHRIELVTATRLVLDADGNMPFSKPRC